MVVLYTSKSLKSGRTFSFLLQKVCSIRTTLINGKFWVLLIIRCLNMFICTHTPLYMCSPLFLFSIQECELCWMINTQFWLYLVKTVIGLLHVFYFLDIKIERDFEMKRLNNLKCQENAEKEIQLALREKQFGLRRPLPPKWWSPRNPVRAFCVWWGTEGCSLPLCELPCGHLNATVDELAQVG